MKKKWMTILILVATLVLAVVMIITALKLSQVGEKPIAPTAPESAPAAQVETPSAPNPCLLSFNVGSDLTSTPTPTSVVTSTPTPTGSPSPSPTPGQTSTPTASPSPGAPTGPQLSPAPTPISELPDSGTISPTIFAILGGIIMVILGLIL